MDLMKSRWLIFRFCGTPIMFIWHARCNWSEMFKWCLMFWIFSSKEFNLVWKWSNCEFRYRLSLSIECIWWLNLSNSAVRCCCELITVSNLEAMQIKAALFSDVMLDAVGLEVCCRVELDGIDDERWHVTEQTHVELSFFGLKFERDLLTWRHMIFPEFFTSPSKNMLS